MKKICVLGLGYIGLPTAAMFATNFAQLNLPGDGPKPEIWVSGNSWKTLTQILLMSE